MFKKKGMIFFSVLVAGIISSSALVLSQNSAQVNEKSEESNHETVVPEEKQKESKQKEETRTRALQVLLKPDFNYASIASVGSNPFVPFIQPREKTVEGQVAEGAPPPPVLLTPLQKMEMGEIEKGFKGILWAAGERRAIIEDPTGKGYIVGVGTPIGTQDGIVSAIFQDRLVIRQKVWDETSRTFRDVDVVLKLRKKPEPGESKE